MMLCPAPAEPRLNFASLPRCVVEGLYVHIPFCFHKCHYCDFYSITRQGEPRMAAFVGRILREAELWMSHPALTITPKSVFFGGGTPSLLPRRAMWSLIGGLQQRFDLSGVREWTVEINPATVDGEYLRMLRDSGVTRISFGAQSFDRAELAMLERHHDPEDVARSVALARTAGFRRINLDLIFAIPGQTIESWLQSLQAARQLAGGHLSCYALTYEPNTPLAVRRRLGWVRPVEESLELEMLRATRQILCQAGFRPYEISNFSQPGEECLHNLLYWD
ncbi:MAG: radical SAM family heme chaperone HemW, partial [Phycisphaerae bacterium]|nr:radical SAM family heme chaperone HemW [Phycisphaerae bacterium]